MVGILSVTAQVVGAVLLAEFIVGSAILYIVTVFIGEEDEHTTD